MLKWKKFKVICSSNNIGSNSFLTLFSSFSWFIDSETNWLSLVPRSIRRENTKSVLRFGVSLLKEKGPGEAMQFVLEKKSIYSSLECPQNYIQFATTKFEQKHILQSGFTIYLYTSVECQNKSCI